MAWPVLNVNSLDHFLKIASHLNYGPVATVPYLFRGQSNHAWSLQPTLTRELSGSFSEDAALLIEQDCKRKFIEQAHLHIPFALLPTADKDTEWWAIMQHHSAPTRLLDWTASPFVAAYFAAVENWEIDGVLWLFHAKTLIESTLKNANSQIQLNLYRAEKPSSRIIAQQGAFVYCNKLLANFEEILDELLTPVHYECGEEVLRKVIIPKELKPQLMRHLQIMNITASSLFPGLDGLGRTASELVRLSCEYPRSIDIKKA
jgi:hypothetical protein